MRGKALKCQEHAQRARGRQPPPVPRRGRDTSPALQGSSTKLRKQINLLINSGITTNTSWGLESGGQQGQLSPRPLLPHHGPNTERGTLKVVTTLLTPPEEGTFPPPSQLSPFLSERAAPPLFCQSYPSLLAWVCNSLLSQNKPIFAGRMSGSFIFKVNNTIFKKKGAEAQG